MFRAFQVLAVLLTLFLASPAHAAALASTLAPDSPASAAFWPSVTLENGRADQEMPPPGLETPIGLLCHNDPVNKIDPLGLDYWSDSQDTVAGYTNALTFGLAGWAFGSNGGETEAMNIGSGIGTATGAAFGVGAGFSAARGVIAARSAASASAAASKVASAAESVLAKRASAQAAAKAELSAGGDCLDAAMAMERGGATLGGDATIGHFWASAGGKIIDPAGAAQYAKYLTAAERSSIGAALKSGEFGARQHKILLDGIRRFRQGANGR